MLRFWGQLDFPATWQARNGRSGHNGYGPHRCPTSKVIAKALSSYPTARCLSLCPMSGFVLVSAIRFPKFNTDVAKANAGIEKYNVVKVWVGFVENLYPTAFEKVEGLDGKALRKSWIWQAPPIPQPQSPINLQTQAGRSDSRAEILHKYLSLSKRGKACCIRRRMDGERGDVGTDIPPSSPYESLHVRDQFTR